MGIYDIALSGVGALFFLFSVHLFVAKKDKRVFTWLLAIIILARGAQICIFLNVRFDNLEIFKFLYRVFTPLFYLAPAALYLYVTRLLGIWQRFSKKQLLHLIPFIIVVVHFLPLGFGKEVEWALVVDGILRRSQFFVLDTTGNIPGLYLLVLRLTIIVGYLVASWSAFLRSEVFKDPDWTILKRWIFCILGFSTFFRLVSVLPLLANGSENILPMFAGANCVFLLILVLYLLHKPELLYNYLLVNVRPEEVVMKTVKKARVVKANDRKDGGVQANSITDFERLMGSDRLFLDPNLQIKDVANHLGLPLHQCSYIINNEIGKSFRDWVNSHRIRYFISSYPQQKSTKTVEAIANEAGFKSLSSFYAAFKKETGLMPKQFFAKK